MKHTKTALLALLLTAGACAPPIPKYTLSLPDRHATLPNGMHIIVLPDPSTPLIEVDMRVEVGSNEDPKGKAGLAHLVEHMMFQQRPVEGQPPLWEYIQHRVLFFNAYTNWDTTHYFLMGKKEELENYVGINGIRLDFRCKTIPPEQFEREREVVRNEIRNGATPEGIVFNKVLATIYPAGHPYGRDIGGDDEQLANITLEDVCKFMDDYYVPERTTLIVAGNVTQEEVQKVAQKWLVGLERRAPAPRAPIPPLELKPQKITLEADIEQPHVMAAWPLPPKYSKDDLAANFLVGAVTGETAFFGEEWDFATNIYPVVVGGGLAPAFLIDVTLKDEGRIGEAMDALGRAARNAHRAFEKGQDFDSFKVRAKARLVYAFESLTARTNLFGEYQQFDKDKKFFAGELARIDSVSGGQIRSLIDRTISMDKALVVVIKRKEGAGHAKAAKLKYKSSTHDAAKDRFAIDPEEARKPLPIPDHNSALSAARRFTLGNGMKVVLLPSSSNLPVMTVNLVFQAGSAHEPPAKAGLAQTAAGALGPACAMMADPDTGRASCVAETDPIGFVGASYGCGAMADHTVCRVRGLNIYSHVLIKGLERLIKAGDYDQTAIESEHKFMRELMKRSKSFAQEVAFERRLDQSIYGAEHPYTLTGDARPETMGKIGRDAAMEFKNDHYTAKNATLIVAGNFDEKAVESQIRSNFGEWGGGHQDKPVSLSPTDRKHPIYFDVDAEENPSMDVTIAYPSPAGVDGQEAARRVLAGMMMDRVSLVRESIGASYGVYARHQTNVAAGVYVISGAVDRERAGEALKAMRDGVDALRRGDDFEVSFARARRAVLRQLLTEQNDSGTLAGQLTFIARYNLPDDYFDKLIRQVAALSPAQVKQLIADELVPEREVVGFLGPTASAKKAFEAAGITSNVDYIKDAAEAKK